MPTYIALLNWTPQGISKVGSSAKRLDAGRKAFKKAGVEIKDTYLTMGRHDLVCVIEAPDDETYAKAILGLATEQQQQRAAETSEVVESAGAAAMPDSAELPAR